MRPIIVIKQCLHFKDQTYIPHFDQPTSDTFINYRDEATDYLRKIQQKSNLFLKDLFVYSICNHFYSPILSRMNILYTPSNNIRNIGEGLFVANELDILKQPDVVNPGYISQYIPSPLLFNTNTLARPQFFTQRCSECFYAFLAKIKQISRVG